MVREVTSDRNVSKGLISTPVDLTSAYQDVGDLINTKGLLNIGLWLKGLLNDSDEVKFRCKCYPSKDAVDYYYTQIQTIDSSKISMKAEEYIINDSIINLVVPLGISQLAPYIRLEMCVTTEGLNPAQIESALLTFEREAR